MRHRIRTLARAAALLAATLLACAAPAARAAAPDGNVEWNGLSHLAWQDRRPLCPVGRESFEVRLKAFRNDLTGVRVRWSDGAAVSWIDAGRIAQRGPYDIWAAQMPASASASPSYLFRAIDGADSAWVSVSGVSETDPADGGFALDFTNLTHAPLGATPATGGTVFRVWAPTPSLTSVRGEFNGWGAGTYLVKTGEYFAGLVPNANPRQQYKYFFNNATWKPDARARSLNPGGSYNSYIENPFGYAWRDSLYGTPPLEKMVVYELHIGTFAGYNDPRGATAFPSRYADVAARAAYLDSLGVNAVQFNPFTEFPTDVSAGYNPVSQWAPESYYGTPDQLKAMVDSLHAHGIAAILDIVWNHFSSSDNYLWNYDPGQIYFDSPTAVDTPWGSQADFDRAAVQDYFANSAMMWLEEYHLDGFRMDATSYMNAYQATAGMNLMKRLNDEKARRFADRVTIAEQLPSNAQLTTPTSLGGAGFDTQYYMTFRDNVRQALFDAAFGDPNMNNVRSALVGSGAYLSGRRAYNYIELHDEAWPNNGGQRLIRNIDTSAPYDDVWAKGRSKLGFGLTIVSPGVPAILQGTEWLESINWGPDAANRIDWSKKATYAGIWSFYRDLIHLRTGMDALRADSPVYVSQVNEAGNVIAYRRYNGYGSEAMVVANFSNNDYTNYRVGVPVAGGWTELVNSQSTKYEGAGPDNPGTLATEATSWDGYGQSLVLNVPKMALLVLAPSATTDAPRDRGAAPRGTRFTRVAPVPAHGGTTVTFALAREGRARLVVHDVTGRAVATLADGTFAAGEHVVRWDGRDAGGAAAPAGLYFLRLAGPDGGDVRRLPLVR